MSLWAATAQADPLIVGNNASGGGGLIETWDFARRGPVASFVPDGAKIFSNNGRGVAVLGNKIYYTELSNNAKNETVTINVAPFNGGAGGADIKKLPTPRPGTGVQDLAVANGVLYALTGYGREPLQVFGLDPVTGKVVSGPVSIAGPASPRSDGFTVLPIEPFSGNFLINNDDDECTYNQYDRLTGALIPATTLTVPANGCTGVDNNGARLIFQTNFTSFTETDITGKVIATSSVTGLHHSATIEDISFVTLGCLGQPGSPSCSTKCMETSQMLPG